MPSVYEIFNGMPEKHNFLRMGWPQLYEAFAATQTTVKAGRIRPCELHVRHPSNPGELPPAIGRLRPAGPAACARCLARLTPDNPGGYPLQIPKRTEE